MLDLEDSCVGQLEHLPEFTNQVLCRAARYLLIVPNRNEYHQPVGEKIVISW